MAKNIDLGEITGKIEEYIKRLNTQQQISWAAIIIGIILIIIGLIL